MVQAQSRHRGRTLQQRDQRERSARSPRRASHRLRASAKQVEADTGEPAHVHKRDGAEEREPHDRRADTQQLTRPRRNIRQRARQLPGDPKGRTPAQLPSPAGK
jgi:hypothetical protein